MVNILEDGFGMIPNKVLFDKKLSSTSKLIYAYISSLCAKEGHCWASNGHIGKKFGLSAHTASRCVSQLENQHYIESSVDKFYLRKVFLVGVAQKEQRGMTKMANPLRQKRLNNNINELNKLKRIKTIKSF